MKETLQALNRMVKAGVMKGYVIGGAVAAAYYLEPVATRDLDVFVQLAVRDSGLMSLSPIYSYLRAEGYKPEGEAVIIEGWAVQILPVFNPLYEEAYEKAVQATFEGVPVRVMTAQHLVAIMVQTGRPKDQVRILQFLEAKAVRRTRLEKVLDRHGLRGKWDKFLQRHQLARTARRHAGRRRRRG